MKKIKSSELAEILNQGFDGEVNLEANVHIREVGKTEDFYMSGGSFTLARESFKEARTYSLGGQGSSITFSIKDGSVAEYKHLIQGRYTVDEIVVPLDSPANCILRIHAGDIKF